MKAAKQLNDSKFTYSKVPVNMVNGLIEEIAPDIVKLGSSTYSVRDKANTRLYQLLRIEKWGLQRRTLSEKQPIRPILREHLERSYCSNNLPSRRFNPFIAVFNAGNNIEKSASVNLMFSTIAANNPAIWPPDFVQFAKSLQLPP